MVELEVTDGAVTVHVEGIHRVLSLHEHVTFDLSRVTRVALAPVDLRPPWLRAPGAFLPGVIAAGTFRGKGRKEFWDTRFDGQAIQIDLSGTDLTRLVIDVPDPDSALHTLVTAAAA
ncbi:hypothetical protein [Nocardia inohanensis]|uniref:hypothetical protein n=1 Tax=Nocardia inohanensis TaxID=209246 RepID=UPI000831BCF3|nr:hypothetical protein [Nocardia inohanensis]